MRKTETTISKRGIAAAALRREAILVHKDPEYERLSEIINLRSLLS